MTPDPIKVQRALEIRLNAHDARRPRGAGVTAALVEEWESERAAIVRAIHVNARAVAMRPSPLERLRAGIANSNLMEVE